MWSFFEEVLYPFNLLWRVLVARRLSWGLAWSLLDTWWPCKFIRRRRALFRVWRAERYRGLNEFHPSLNMDAFAMLEMTEAERERYLDNLIRRRNVLHNRGLACRLHTSKTA